ncbi:MAG TPA: aspartate kinase [Candidatus Dormibacteraeota bacterium]|nr:aspartate kinase [Candidatus Dormibacteraeota bacterium]
MSPEFLQQEPAVEQRTAQDPALSDPLVHAQTNDMPTLAFKFGGTSLLGADRMLKAAALVRDAAKTARVIVVVSAMKGITDRLLEIAHSASARTEAESIVGLHHKVLKALSLPAEIHSRVNTELSFLGRDLIHEAVKTPDTATAAAANPELLDRLASFGERFSARLFATSLEKIGVAAVPVSSSDFIVTCGTFRDAQPHLAQCQQKGREVLLPLLHAGIVPVVTGFIGATPDGRITTLGRNSSDFSGAITAHIIDAQELIIWTDVDGIYSDNPNESDEAKMLHNLSYDEAHALAAGGAKVLHPRVLPLAAETEMTVWVRNTFKPHLRGTRIGAAFKKSSSLRGSL